MRPGFNGAHDICPRSTTLVKKPKIFAGNGPVGLRLLSMAQYSFTISDGEPFVHSEELPDDKAAWREAVRTVRDAQARLSPSGSEWSLVRGEKALYRIDVTAKTL